MKTGAKEERAISDVIDIALLAILVIALAAVIFALFSGYLSVLFQEQPLIAMQSEVVPAGDGGFIVINHKGGQEIILSQGGVQHSCRSAHHPEGV